MLRKETRCWDQKALPTQAGGTHLASEPMDSKTLGAGVSGLSPHGSHLPGASEAMPTGLGSSTDTEDKDSGPCGRMDGGGRAGRGQNTGAGPRGLEKQQLCPQQQKLKDSHLRPCLWQGEHLVLVVCVCVCEFEKPQTRVQVQSFIWEVLRIELYSLLRTPPQAML